MTDEAEESAKHLAETHGLRYVDLTQSAVAPGAASLLPGEVARRHRAVPIGRRLGTPVIAVSDPGDPFAMDALRESVGREFVAVVAPVAQIDKTIDELYGPAEPGAENVSADEGEGESISGADAVGDVAGGGSGMETSDGSLGEAGGTGDGIGDGIGDGTGDGVRDGVGLINADDDTAVSTATGLDVAGDAMGASPDGAGDGEVGGGGEGEGAGGGGEAGGGGDSGGGGEFPSIDPPPRVSIADLVSADLDAAPANLPLTAVGLADGGSGASSFDATSPATLDPGGDSSSLGTWQPEEPAPTNGRSAEGQSLDDIAPAGGQVDVLAAAAAALEGVTDSTVPTLDPFSPAGVRDDAAASGGSIAGSLEDSLREILSPPVRSEGPLFAPLPPIPVGETPSGAGLGDVGAAPTEAGGANQEQGPGAPPAAPDGYGIVTSSEVDAALAYAPPLARVLVQSGRVTPEEMAVALREHVQAGESLARYLFNHDLATEDDLVRAMAEEVGLEYVDLNEFPIDAAAQALIPEAVARNHMVLPIAIDKGVPVIAMANPTDVFAMDDLRTIMGRNFTPVVASRTQISVHLRYSQQGETDVEGAALEATGDSGSAAFELETLQTVVEDAPIVRYVNLLILQALNERASDIHIEPTPKRMRVRFRIDGVMHDATSASPSIHSSVVSRLKVLGEMDITERRVPQEGRVSLAVGDRQIDLRLATLPSLFGESAVMRLLDKSASIRSLPDLGFFADTLERFATAYRHPYGVILVTGPTGAGKTTTLYATLQEVITNEKSVITVEDPVEYQIDGITQVQINKKAGLGFSSALRSILRADPDIVLIGEIRDRDTAAIAMEAALSGHLVLSTLHTNNAAGTPLRLTEMGIEPFLVTSATTAILTQRLARVLCSQCKEAYDASEKEFISAGYKDADLEGLDTSTLYRAVGCRRCGHTGYLGRAVLAEVMEFSEEIDRLVIQQASIGEIERAAVEAGMRPLRQDGLRKALIGDTTLEEVLRVVV